MHAVVTVPPVEDFYFTRHRFSALGAQIVYNILLDMGLETEFYNFSLLRAKGSFLPLPEELGYLKDFILPNEVGRLSFFTRYQRFGFPSKECAKMICSNPPGLCCISCFAFGYATQAIELAQDVKRLCPETIILVGGAGVSAYPLFFMKIKAISFAIIGEAEIALKGFIKELNAAEPSYETVPNLFWKEGDSVYMPHTIRFTRADEIAPVWDKTFEDKKAFYLTISLTRGCPKDCRFCSISISHGQIFRKTPIMTVKKGLSTLIEDKGLLIDIDKEIRVNFEDDNLLLDPSYLLEVMDEIRRRWGRVSFFAENGLDYTLLSPDILSQLIKKGMRKFNLTLASVDQKRLEREGRISDIERYKGIQKILHAHSIPSVTYIICGFEGDTREGIARTLAFLAGQPTLIGISMYYAPPGRLKGSRDTPCSDEFSELSTPLSPRLFAGSSAYPWTGAFATHTLVTAFRLSRYINLLKRPNKTKIEHDLISCIIETGKIHTLIRESDNLYQSGQSCLKITEVPHMDQGLVEIFFKRLKDPDTQVC